jgi:hypothetical protein
MKAVCMETRHSAMKSKLPESSACPGCRSQDFAYTNRGFFVFRLQLCGGPYTSEWLV